MYTIEINGLAVYEDSDHGRILGHYAECCRSYCGSIVLKHDGVQVAQRASRVTF